MCPIQLNKYKDIFYLRKRLSTRALYNAIEKFLTFVRKIMQFLRCVRIVFNIKLNINFKLTLKTHFTLKKKDHTC
jgi:uncharacterized protein YlbG (UPF0298 family)